MDLEELKQKQMQQLIQKGWSSDSKEMALHLAEEAGEVCEAVRENQSKSDLQDELADVLWHLNRLAK